MGDELVSGLLRVFQSPNVLDSNGETANMVDVIDRLARSITSAATCLGTGNAMTDMGAIEMHAVAIKDAASEIASAIRDLAEVVREHAGA